jgi:endonuclease YncB( thermonuclease family)
MRLTRHILTEILQNTEKRQFGTISVGKREDVGEVLVAEGLAVTQRHRDDDEKSPRYDELCAAEVSWSMFLYIMM